MRYLYIMLIVYKKSKDGLDLIGKQGTTWRLRFSIKDDSGAPIDLTGYSVRAQMRKSYSAPTKYDFNCTITSAHTGEIEIFMPANITAGIPVVDTLKFPTKENAYVYDVEIEKDGEVMRVLEGIIYVDPECTK